MDLFDREIAQALEVLQVAVIVGVILVKIELYGAIDNLRLVNLIQNRNENCMTKYSFDSVNLIQNRNELLESAESLYLTFILSFDSESEYIFYTSFKMQIKIEM